VGTEGPGTSSPAEKGYSPGGTPATQLPPHTTLKTKPDLSRHNLQLANAFSNIGVGAQSTLGGHEILKNMYEN